MLRRLGMAALIIGAAVACGKPAEGPKVADQPPVWVEAKCPPHDPVGGSEKRGGIPKDFVATAVMRCRGENRDFPGEGTWTVRITERADGPVPKLLDMLRRPSDPLPPDVNCPAIAYGVPYFMLVDKEGRALLPAVPTTPCGKPHDEVTNFLDKLPYRTVTETRVAQVTSQRAHDTGCADRWKDTIAIEVHTPSVARSPAPAGDIQVCVYTSDGTVGQLDTGFSLTGQEAAALRATLDAAGPPHPCGVRHTRFAVLTPSKGGVSTVELDGCTRVQLPDNTIAQLSPDAVAVLMK